MNIEKLTPDEREYLASPPNVHHPERKALRIIEQQAVEIARLAEAASRAERECALLRESLEQRPTLPPTPSTRPLPPTPTVPAPPPGRYRLVRREEAS